MRKLLVLTSFTFLITSAIPSSFAETKSQPGKMVEALEKLKNKGYVIVKKIEFKENNNAYDAQVINAAGKILNVEINAATGVVTKTKNDIEGYTAREIALKVESAGYNNILSIKADSEGKEFDVKALNSEGDETKIKVDVDTGSITNVEKE